MKTIDRSLLLPQRAKVRPRVAYITTRGTMIKGHAEDVLASSFGKKLKGRVDLLFTSPPFPLNRKKKYGNEIGEAYVEWLAAFAPLFRDLLAPKGSIVLEMGNAWEPGKPVMSTLALKALLEFLERGRFYLCQQFICFNPTRLPSPAEWVNVRRIRAKAAVDLVWWLSKTEWPKADNRRVLREYSDDMLRLLKRGYRNKARPSGHNITSKFKKIIAHRKV